MEAVKAFLARKDIEISVQRYLIDALGAMAQGLFASLLMGTILSTIGQQAGWPFLVEVGDFAKSAAGPAMAVAIAFALKSPALVLFSMVAVGYAANALGGAGGPLAVLVVAVFAAEAGKVVSGETKIDILVTPLVTILVGCLLSMAWAPAIGAAATWVGGIIMWATELQPFFMGIIVSVLVGIALTLPISSAAICAALGLTGLAGGAAVAGCCAQMVGFAIMGFKENRWGGFDFSGFGNINASDGQHRTKPSYLDSAYLGLRYHRSYRNVFLPAKNERCGNFFRHGNVWSCWTDWSVHGLAFRYCIRRYEFHYGV